ncbi:hypothetical protein AN644_01270 [Candidatus Epulonipiscium fishelsonii]|nr:hypothetical protein AN644_01270 [Epulopiscium sp. SCG-C06WGA-EpuloA1]
MISCPNISFSNVDMKTEIQKHLNLDVYVENDANLAALAEVIAGAAQGTTNTIVITLGTGVGGGIIIDGKIYRGSFWGAGEVGHQVIKFDNGHLCGCGKTGCWEQYASATALIRDAKEAILNTTSTLLELSEDNITAKTIFEAANKGDLVAKDILDNYLYFVALGLTNLINVLQPEVILIGGGMSAQKEKLIEPIKNHISSLLSHGQDLKTEIKCAILGNDAGIIGAGLLGTTFNN